METIEETTTRIQVEAAALEETAAIQVEAAEETAIAIQVEAAEEIAAAIQVEAAEETAAADHEQPFRWRQQRR